MTWILVLIFYKGGVSTQEFNTEAACSTAKMYISAEFKREMQGAGGLLALCVQKGKQ